MNSLLKNKAYGFWQDMSEFIGIFVRNPTWLELDLDLMETFFYHLYKHDYHNFFLAIGHECLNTMSVKFIMTSTQLLSDYFSTPILQERIKCPFRTVYDWRLNLAPLSINIPCTGVRRLCLTLLRHASLAFTSPPLFPKRWTRVEDPVCTW